MRLATILILPALLLSTPGIAADKSFTGVFEGAGRACAGKLHIQKKNIQWDSSFSRCKPTQYQTLEADFSQELKRFVFYLKKRNNQCLYSIVEVEQEEGYRWNITGYSSLEEYQNRNPLPSEGGEGILSCPMIKLD
jgi:hypothetical protein